ncbi:MAG: hypothetical protein JJE15_00950 [Desulfobacteraceae bacterium]|nr:hypothetical protein [Desulfobacteraceae bacterium]
MKWDIIHNKRREKKGKPKDDVDRIIQTIEKFAPREHRSERDAFFYNYKMMGPYLKPLLSLLETLSQKNRLKSDQASLARELFLKLKDFYDPRDRLTLDEAAEDTSLRRKFRQLFLFFYGKKDLSSEDIRGWLKGI